MRPVETLLTTLTIICVASTCVAGLVAFMLWRETQRVLRSARAIPMSDKHAGLLALPDRTRIP
ncbi:MAG: hypothetical protein H6879_00500 [Rhodobiaceae bacterium]|nr:hypothetical protein [Rhodobiaceae bacterium]